MTDRIAITEETKARVNDFRKGAGLTYDEALKLMLDVLSGDGMDDLGEIAAMLNYARKTGRKISKPQIIE
jgi:hypothetical protein